MPARFLAIYTQQVARILQDAPHTCLNLVIHFIGHTNMMYSEIHLLDPLCSTQDQIQIFTSTFGQGLDINLDMCLVVEKTHTDTGRTCKLTVVCRP